MPILKIVLLGGTPITHELNRDRTVFGRAPNCDVQLLDGASSKQHFAIENILGDYFIADLGSKNGTFVNNLRLIGKKVLQDGDLIEVGDVHIKYTDEMSRNSPLNSDSLMAIEGYTLTLTVMNGSHQGTTYDVSKLLTTIGKRNQQVAVLQHRPSGMFLTHLEGVPTKLNCQPLGGGSIKLNSGDLIEICEIQLKVAFVARESLLAI